MPNERRQGGVVLGGEVGLDLLLGALRFFPGARIELIGERPLAPELAQHPQLSLAGGLEGEDLQARLECAAYLVVPAVNGDPLPRELRLHHETVRFVTDDEWFADGGQSGAARRGFLKERVLAVQRVQRLRMIFTRKRPEPRARSAAQDHGLDHRRRDAELYQGAASPRGN